MVLFVNNLLDIPSLPGYKIDELGNIYSFKRYKEGKKKSPYVDKDGYLCVSVMVNNKAKAFKVHRLVAMTFLNNPDNLPQVNHRDANKQNNHFNNLEWVTNERNQRHAWDADLKTIKLKTEQVREIKRLLGKHNNTEISKLYGVDPSTISNIRTGRTWKTIVLDNL